MEYTTSSFLKFSLPLFSNFSLSHYRTFLIFGIAILTFLVFCSRCLRRASLGGGVGTGLVLILAGYLSLKAFEKRKNSYFVTAALLTWVMGQRYYQTSKIMPAGIIAGISALMTGFYLYKIATGGNHITAKAE